MPNNKPSNNGFSLIEIIVTISIFAIISVLGSSLFTSGYKASKFLSDQDAAVTNARKAMSITSKEIRGANSSEKGDYAILKADNQDLIFYSDINSDGKTEKIRYYLDNLTLKKTITKADINNNYSETPTISTISKYINNQTEDIFKYYDSNKNETSQINNIRLIKVRLKVNVTPGISPNDYYVESDVHLRNLKDNL